MILKYWWEIECKITKKLLRGHSPIHDNHILDLVVKNQVFLMSPECLQTRGFQINVRFRVMLHLVGFSSTIFLCR